MKYCVYCGAQVENDSRFCENCGKSLIDTEKEYVPDQTEKKGVDAGGDFGSDEDENPEGDGCDPGRKKKILIPVILVIAAVVILVAVLFAMKSKGSDTGENSSVSEDVSEDTAEGEDESGTLALAVSKITLNQIGETVQIELGNDTVSADEVTWFSSDESVASVDETGCVTAVSAGETTVTAQWKSQRVICKIVCEIEGTTEEGSEETDDEESNETDEEDIDVEAAVLAIREKYNEIVSGISTGSYSSRTVDNSITVYSDQDEIVALIVNNGYSSNTYTRYYYYDNGELFFAYYEASDSHRFYFLDEQLIRWRYCSDASDSSNAENHDLSDSAEYRSWEETVLLDSENIRNICD